ncbi:hypothetical protein PIB30_106142, partial [Stylosanthes scabra]|nr:hypothetical protein [Stylosanthes scabra]
MLGSGGTAKNSSRKTTPAVVFSSKEIEQTTNSMNQPLGSFDALGLTERDLEAHSDDLVIFSGERVTPDGFITLWVTIRNPPDTRNVKVRWLMVNHNFVYMM